MSARRHGGRSPWPAFARSALTTCALLAACASTPSDAPETVTGLDMTPFSSNEECVQLAADDRLDYDFTSNQPVDFNIHYREGYAEILPISRDKVEADSGRFVAVLTEKYCLTWQAGAPGALLDYRIVVRRAAPGR
jgi:hypothetical protein